MLALFSYASTSLFVEKIYISNTEIHDIYFCSKYYILTIYIYIYITNVFRQGHSFTSAYAS